LTGCDISATPSTVVVGRIVVTLAFPICIIEPRVDELDRELLRARHVRVFDDVTANVRGDVSVGAENVVDASHWSIPFSVDTYNIVIPTPNVNPLSEKKSFFLNKKSFNINDLAGARGDSCSRFVLLPSVVALQLRIIRIQLARHIS